MYICINVCTCMYVWVAYTCNQSLSITHNYRIDLKQLHLSLNKFLFNTLLSQAEASQAHTGTATATGRCVSLPLCFVAVKHLARCTLISRCLLYIRTSAILLFVFHISTLYTFTVFTSSRFSRAPCATAYSCCIFLRMKLFAKIPYAGECCF